VQLHLHVRVVGERLHVFGAGLLSVELVRSAKDRRHAFAKPQNVAVKKVCDVQKKELLFRVGLLDLIAAENCLGEASLGGLRQRIVVLPAVADVRTDHPDGLFDFVKAKSGNRKVANGEAGSDAVA
jgi:hypothetical protein